MYTCHKSSPAFTVTLHHHPVAHISLFSRALQYLAAVLITAEQVSSGSSHKESKESIAPSGESSERNETLGVVLIIINLVVMLASMVSCMAIVLNLGRKIKRLSVPKKSVEPEKSASSIRLFLRCHQSLLREKKKGGLTHELQ